VFGAPEWVRRPAADAHAAASSAHRRIDRLVAEPDAQDESRG
jgi:hypothetical protein